MLGQRQRTRERQLSPKVVAEPGQSTSSDKRRCRTVSVHNSKMLTVLTAAALKAAKTSSASSDL
jgi:hypothetical protein